MRGGLALAEVTDGGRGDAVVRRRVQAEENPLLAVLPLLGVAALISAVIWRLQDVLHLPNAIQPVWGSLFLAALTVFIGRTARETRAPFAHPVARALVLLLLVALLGAAWSLAPRGSLSFLVKRLIPSVGTAWVAAAAVRHVRDAEKIAAVTVLGAAGFCLNALQVGYFGQDGRWTGFPYYDPNDLALHLVAVIPLAVYFFRRGGSLVPRLLAAPALALFLMVIVKTESRGGLVGLAVVACYLAATFRAIPTRWRYGGLLAGALAFSSLGSERYWSRIQTMLDPESDYNLRADDPTGRKQLWRRGLGYAAERPILGVGLNSYLNAERMLSPTAREARIEARPLNFLLVAHNTFIHVAAELGLVGLGVFLFALWSAWRALVRVRRARKAAGADAADSEAAMAHALIASLLGFVVCGVFLSAPYFPLLYLLLGLAIGMERAAAPAAPLIPEPALPAPSLDTAPRGSRAELVPGRGGLAHGVALAAAPEQPAARLPAARGGGW